MVSVTDFLEAIKACVPCADEAKGLPLYLVGLTVWHEGVAYTMWDGENFELCHGTSFTPMRGDTEFGYHYAGHLHEPAIDAAAERLAFAIHKCKQEVRSFGECCRERMGSSEGASVVPEAATNVYVKDISGKWYCYYGAFFNEVFSTDGVEVSTLSSEDVVIRKGHEADVIPYLGKLLSCFLFSVPEAFSYATAYKEAVPTPAVHRVGGLYGAVFFKWLDKHYTVGVRGAIVPATDGLSVEGFTEHDMGSGLSFFVNPMVDKDVQVYATELFGVWKGFRIYQELTSTYAGIHG